MPSEPAPACKLMSRSSWAAPGGIPGPGHFCARSDSSSGTYLLQRCSIKLTKTFIKSAVVGSFLCSILLIFLLSFSHNQPLVLLIPSHHPLREGPINTALVPKQGPHPPSLTVFQIPLIYPNQEEDREWGITFVWRLLKRIFCHIFMHTLLPVSPCYNCQSKGHIFYPGFSCPVERWHQYSNIYNKYSHQVFAEIDLTHGINSSYLYLLSQHVIHGKEENFMRFFFIPMLKEVCNHYARVKVIWIKIQQWGKALGCHR